MTTGSAARESESGRQRTIWMKPGSHDTVQIIDQRFLPHEFVTEDLRTVDDVVGAIRDMHVRGAPLIGAAAGYGVWLAARKATTAADVDRAITEAADRLKGARPTAINLAWAVDRVVGAAKGQVSAGDKVSACLEEANRIVEEEVGRCRQIGEHGLPLIERIAESKDSPVNILTHCNAGWLACVEHGTATAPIYLAHDRGIAVHVWVDETRPRNQGAGLTAWELGRHRVPHTVITDNAGGHLMQQGLVDMVIVGSDRTTSNGDVVNKIGTYLKALAAKDNGIPFYVALPSSSIDWNAKSGADVPIEERDPGEVHSVRGFADGAFESVRVTPDNSPAANHGFDVTPARLVTGLITERGILDASTDGLSAISKGGHGED